MEEVPERAGPLPYRPLEDLPETEEPTPGLDPYSLLEGFGGDPQWLARTGLGLAEPWADLRLILAECDDFHDPRAIAALERLRQQWELYGDQFEQLTANGPVGDQQASIWRAEIERLTLL